MVFVNNERNSERNKKKLQTICPLYVAGTFLEAWASQYRTSSLTQFIASNAHAAYWLQLLLSFGYVKDDCRFFVTANYLDMAAIFL